MKIQPKIIKFCQKNSNQIYYMKFTSDDNFYTLWWFDSKNRKYTNKFIKSLADSLFTEGRWIKL